MPVQGTCQPSVRKSFFFGGSFDSFCSFIFDVVAFGADLEVTVFGCTFNKILMIISIFTRQDQSLIANFVPYRSEALVLQPLDSTRQE